jgi:glucose uptake protein GlcU
VDRSAIDSLIEALSPLPMWRKVLVIIGGLLWTGGALWLKVTMSLAGVAWGLGALALGVVVAALSQVGRGTPTRLTPD